MALFGANRMVEKSILDDMIRLNPNINLSDYYVINGPGTSAQVLKSFRTYYSKHLPVALPVWIKLFPVVDGDESIAYNMGFIQGCLNVLFHEKEYDTNPVMVIGFCPPKKDLYPIFKLDIEKYHLTLVITNLSGKWYVSVKTDITLHSSIADFLFDEDESIDIRAVSFPEEYCFGAFSENRKNFSFLLNSDYDLYAFCMVLKKFLSKEVYL
jgi:hypothetical protein